MWGCKAAVIVAPQEDDCVSWARVAPWLVESLIFHLIFMCLPVYFYVFRAKALQDRRSPTTHEATGMANLNRTLTWNFPAWFQIATFRRLCEAFFQRLSVFSVAALTLLLLPVYIVVAWTSWPLRWLLAVMTSRGRQGDRVANVETRHRSTVEVEDKRHMNLVMEACVVAGLEHLKKTPTQKFMGVTLNMADFKADLNNMTTSITVVENAAVKFQVGGLSFHQGAETGTRGLTGGLRDVGFSFTVAVKRAADGEGPVLELTSFSTSIGGAALFYGDYDASGFLSLASRLTRPLLKKALGNYLKDMVSSRLEALIVRRFQKVAPIINGHLKSPLACFLSRAGISLQDLDPVKRTHRKASRKQ